MFKFFKEAIDSSSSTSSRRTVLLYYAIVIGSFIAVGTVALAYVICLTKVDKPSSVTVLKYMVYFMGLLFLFILLLTGVITWQNINDTIASVKGLPPGVQQQIEKTIEKTTATTTTTQPPA